MDMERDFPGVWPRKTWAAMLLEFADSPDASGVGVVIGTGGELGTSGDDMARGEANIRRSSCEFVE